MLIVCVDARVKPGHDAVRGARAFNPGLPRKSAAVEKRLFLRRGGAAEHRVAVGSVVSSVFVAAYFVMCWTLSGRTPGKALMGLKVIGADGQRPHAGRAILRFFGYIVSTIPIYLGFLWVLVGNHRLGWHDHLATTRVVYVPPRRRVVEAGG